MKSASHCKNTLVSPTLLLKWEHIPFRDTEGSEGRARIRNEGVDARTGERGGKKGRHTSLVKIDVSRPIRALTYGVSADVRT